MYKVLKTYLRKFIRTSFGGWLQLNLLTVYIKFCSWTSRVTVINEDYVLKELKNDKSFIIACWHNRLSYFNFIWPSHYPRNMCGFASNHNDGRIIADLIKKFGHDQILVESGNSKKALKDSIEYVKMPNHVLSYTPDGPTGPAKQVKWGIIAIAKQADIKILPVSAISSKHKTANSWDRMHVPLPFSHTKIYWGEPVSYRKNHDTDKACQDLTKRLNHCEDSLNN